MIDLTIEKLVPLSEVPTLLPSGRRGRKLNYATVWRWVTKGARGRVLESVVVGGSRFTSREALARFSDQRGGLVKVDIRTPAARRRAMERAARELDADGVR